MLVSLFVRLAFLFVYKYEQMFVIGGKIMEIDYLEKIEEVLRREIEYFQSDLDRQKIEVPEEYADGYKEGIWASLSYVQDVIEDYFEELK